MVAVVAVVATAPQHLRDLPADRLRADLGAILLACAAHCSDDELVRLAHVGYGAVTLEVGCRDHEWTTGKLVIDVQDIAPNREPGGPIRSTLHRITVEAGAALIPGVAGGPAAAPGAPGAPTG